MRHPLPNLYVFSLMRLRRSIVNGLRDDDGESYYGDRASFYSEYSVKDTNENVKLFFKEHERKSSKASNSSSFLSRKKPPQPKGSARPETKVCVYPRARLIASDAYRVSSSFAGLLQF